jgi:hypothetical protein
VGSLLFKLVEKYNFLATPIFHSPPQKLLDMKDIHAIRNNNNIKKKKKKKKKKKLRIVKPSQTNLR